MTLSNSLRGPENKYLPNIVLNLDETPILFRFLDSYIYDNKGNKIVVSKTK
jgi:hypothetical protein